MVESFLRSTTNPVAEALTSRLRQLLYPGLPVSVRDLGMIERIDSDINGNVEIRIVLPDPECPVCQEMPCEIMSVALASDGVASCAVKIVTTPAWTPERISPEGRALLHGRELPHWGSR